MVGALDHLQRRPGAEWRADLAHQAQVGQIVAGALKEQHGHGDSFQVLGAADARAFGRMQREAQEDQAANPG